MQKDVTILLRIGGATGRNILAGILKRIKDMDNGCECSMFNSSESEDGALGTWLKGLPKPAAVFCAWDAVTADVAFAARKAKNMPRGRVPSWFPL